MIHDVFKHPYWSNLVDTCMRTYALYGKQLFLRQFWNARELGPCKITVLYCNLQLSRNLFIPPKFDHLDYLSIYFFLLIIFPRFGGIFFLQQRLQKWFSIQRKDFTWHSLAFNHTLSIAYIFSPREIALAGCLDWFSSLLGFAFYRRLKMISIRTTKMWVIQIQYRNMNYQSVICALRETESTYLLLSSLLGWKPKEKLFKQRFSELNARGKKLKPWDVYKNPPG